MKKLNVKKLIVFFLILVFLVFCLFFGLFCFSLSPVSKEAKEEEYTISLGKSVNEIFDDLEKEGYIKDAFTLKIYSKIFKNDGIDAGTYKISKSYSAPKIYEILSTDNISSAEEIEFVISDGDTIDDVIETISDLSGASTEEVRGVFTNSEYINELISAYWFLTDDILNENIYYSLEGYLFPDTYRVYKDASVKDYIVKALENTKNKLEDYRESINNSDMSVHEIMTMASILQREGMTFYDMKTIAGVFVNRLEEGMGLGSDVTTYYANKIKIGSRDLTDDDINNCDNLYNTRCSDLLTLPVGPIGAFNIDALKAALSPDNNNYYYFVTDKEGNLYASKTYSEHLSTISRLQNEGLWYEFE